MRAEEVAAVGVMDHSYCSVMKSRKGEKRRERKKGRERKARKVVMEPQQNQPESMPVEESCVVSPAKDDRVEDLVHQEDVDENDPAPKREWRE